MVRDEFRFTIYSNLTRISNIQKDLPSEVCVSFIFGGKAGSDAIEWLVSMNAASFVWLGSTGGRTRLGWEVPRQPAT